jgi:hypothetical protein
VKSIQHQFRDFVAKKAAQGGTFNFVSPSYCALAQFGRSLGYPEAVGVTMSFQTTWGGPSIEVLDMCILNMLFSYTSSRSMTQIHWSDLLTALDRHMSIPAEYRVVGEAKELADA